MALDILLQEAKGMSEEALMQVVQYMRFLKWEKKKPQETTSTAAQKPILRQPGLYQDMIQIADDFDAPMDDFKEYM